MFEKFKGGPGYSSVLEHSPSISLILVHSLPWRKNCVGCAHRCARVVWVCYLCVRLRSCMQMPEREETGVLLYHSPPIPLSVDLSLTLEINKWTASPTDRPASIPSSAHQPVQTLGQDRNLGAHAWGTCAFTH